MTEFISKNKPLFYIILTGLFVRILYEFEMSASPYWAAPFLDELYNYLRAKDIASGHLFLDQPFFKAPLYSYFLGILVFIFNDDFFLIKIIQHFIGLSSIIVVYFLSIRLFDKKTAIISSLICALYAPFIFYEGELLDTFLQLLFYPSILLMALKLIEKKEYKSAVILGIIMGLSALARPTIILFIPILLIYIYFCWKKSLAISKILNYLILIVIAFLITISPATLHNIFFGKDFVPIASYGGINFQIGNGEFSDGLTAGMPEKYLNIGQYNEYVEIYSEKESELLTGKKLTPSEQSKFWFNKTVEYMKSNPVKAMKLMLKKHILFWNARDIRNNKDIYFVSEYSQTLKYLLYIFNFGIIGTLGLGGIYLSLKEKRSDSFLLIGFIITYWIGTSIYFVCGRFRLPVVPLMIIFSGFCIIKIYENIINKSMKNWGLVICLLISAIFINYNWYNINGYTDRPRDLWNVANCYKEKGDYQNAIEYYNQVTKLSPNYLSAYTNLGEVYYATQNYNEAIVYFSKALEKNKNYIKAYNNIGACYEAMGDYKKAIENYKLCLNYQPEHYIARSNLADALFKQGDYKNAEEEYKKVLEIAPDYQRAVDGLKKSKEMVNKITIN